MTIYSGDTIEKNGKSYRVTIETDTDHWPPWREEDGHGPVTDWVRRDKRPGERVLNSDRGSYRYYDFAEAVKIARADGWDAPPYKTGTKGEQANRAAEADYRHMLAWCNDDWQWVGVIITPLCPCCGQPIENKSESLWGIESSDNDYLETVAYELIDQVAVEADCDCET